MTQYEFLKSKILKMNNKILQTTLIIVDNAEGVSHDDFFEIAELCRDYLEPKMASTKPTSVNQTAISRAITFYDTANDRWYSIGTHVYSGTLLNNVMNNKGGGYATDWTNAPGNYYNIPSFGNIKRGEWDTFIQKIDKEGF